MYQLSSEQEKVTKALARLYLSVAVIVSTRL